MEDALKAELPESRQRIAELEAREEERKLLQERTSRLASFPEQNPNPVIETDLDGQVTYLNPVAKGRFPGLDSGGHEQPILEGLNAIIETFKGIAQIRSFVS